MFQLYYGRLWYTLSVALIGVVWWLSLTPHPPTIDLPYGDKWGHLAAYATQMLWFAAFIPRSYRWLPALSLCAMGALLEVLQGMTDYRTFEYADMAANAMGVLMGWFLLEIILLARKKHAQ